MVTEPQYIKGVFKAEIKNRFLCLVDINGTDTICYIASSCRLSNFLDLTGREVLLKPVMTPNARTKFSVYAVKHKKSFVLVNLSTANALIDSQLHRRYFSFLGKRKNTLREAKISGYKSDLYIKDTNTILEIKSILAFDRVAAFPTIFSERAILQLQAILNLLDQGYNVCYLVVSLNPYVKEVHLSPDIDKFYNLFLECVSKGMQYHAFSLRLAEGEPELYSKLQFLIMGSCFSKKTDIS